MKKTIALISTILVFAQIAQAAPITQPKEYASAIEAQKDFHQAINNKSKESLLKIFGANGRELIFSGDDVADNAAFEKLAYNMGKKNDLVSDGSSKMYIEAGKNDWIFPIPLVEKAGKWSFNVNDGKEEIINRRIGENEINAIKIAKFYVEAQKLYYSEDRDSDGIKEYAKKLLSTPGKKDGLFWNREVMGEVSPFDPFVVKAIGEGYHKNDNAPTVYKGYYFKVLNSQGNAAKSGKKNYLDKNGNQVNGFALAAYPSEWGTSGIMSFIVNQDGEVFEKNFGKGTKNAAAALNTFEPDTSWKIVY